MRARLGALDFATNYVPEPNTGCWLWLGPVDAKGYGHTRSSLYPGVQRAHRMFYLHHKGPIPPGMQVCHACDVRSCVNPEHLWLGTNEANQFDMTVKGRRGARTPRSLSAAAVRQIRAAHAAGTEISTLSREFGANWMVVKRLVTRRTYRDIQ